MSNYSFYLKPLSNPILTYPHHLLVHVNLNRAKTWKNREMDILQRGPRPLRDTDNFWFLKIVQQLMVSDPKSRRRLGDILEELPDFYSNRR